MLGPMSPAAAERPRPRSRKKRKRKGPGVLAWWPLALALLLTPFAVRAASVLALSGPGALRLLFPFVVVVQALAPEGRDTLAAFVMWAQFPVYGLLVALLARKDRLLAGFSAVALLHAVAVAAAVLLAR